MYSPVLLTPALRARIAQLGRVDVIVAPNMWHHTFVAQWQAGGSPRIPPVTLFRTPSPVLS